jgi:superfamily II DNA or RNA helicase
VCGWGRRGATGTRRTTLVFAVDRAHIRALVAAFSEAGLTAAGLDGDTDRGERAALLRRFAAGELRVLVNCGASSCDLPALLSST